MDIFKSSRIDTTANSITQRIALNNSNTITATATDEEDQDGECISNFQNLNNNWLNGRPAEEANEFLRQKRMDVYEHKNKKIENE